MKAVFIGADSETADRAELSLRLRWPGNPPFVATQATTGLELNVNKRYKLGDSAFEPCWIANVHGTGYHFIGPVDSARE